MKKIIVCSLLSFLLGAYGYHVYQRETGLAELSAVNASLKRINDDLQANYQRQAQLHAEQRAWQQDWKAYEARKSELGEEAELAAEFEQLNHRKEELDAKEKEYIARSVQLNTEWSKLVNERR